MKSLLIVSALIASIALPASAQQDDHSFKPQHHRGPQASDRNLNRVSRTLERMIGNLQHDQHDYAGHRLAAIADLQKAREEIEAARIADKKH